MRERLGMLLVLFCLCGAVVLGLDMILRPERHLRGYIGGEMHRDLRKTEIQILGVLVIAGGSWAVCHLIWAIWTTCFG